MPSVSHLNSVVLGSFGDPVHVNGKEKPSLTWAQYHVVKALIEAGNDGLTKDQLDVKSGRFEARKILRRLANSDPDWAAVIKMAGRPGCHYRIPNGKVT